MFLFMFSLMILSILFFITKNPLPMGLILVVQTILIALNLAPLNKSFWFLYLLMLIFIGGMLVMFMYVISILPNEMFSINQNNSLTMIFSLFMLIMSMYFYKMMTQSISLDSLKTNFSLNLNLSLQTLYKMYSNKTNMLTLFLIIYLLLCMIIIIHISGNFSGPIRKS